jgi:hypothetical protein
MLIQLSLAIGFAGILVFLVFKLYSGFESHPVSTLNHSRPSQMASKKIILPSLKTTDTQKTTVLTDLNKQQAELIPKKAIETSQTQNPIATESKKLSRKSLDKSQTEELVLDRLEKVPERTTVKVKAKEVSLASAEIIQNQPKKASKPVQTIKKTLTQTLQDTSLASISGLDMHQGDSVIDEQEASVRERSANRLKLDKLGMSFSVESLLKVSRQGDVQALKLLLAGGLSPNIKESVNGISPLLEGAKYGQLQVVMTLLEKGANPDIRNHEGQTALMLAAQKGDKRILQALIKSGARPDVKDLKGWSARSYAEQAHNSELIALFGGN